MSLYSTDPKFGFELDFDTRNTFVISQERPNQAEQLIYLHPADAEDLIKQLQAMLKSLNSIPA